MSEQEKPFCCRCQEDFPIAKEPTTWRMGYLRELKKAPTRIREQFREWRQKACQHRFHPARVNDKPGRHCCICELTEELSPEDFFAHFGEKVWKR